MRMGTLIGNAKGRAAVLVLAGGILGTMVAGCWPAGSFDEGTMAEAVGEPWVDPVAGLHDAPVGSYVSVTMRDGRTVSGYLAERSASTLTVRGIGWTANQRTICEVVDIVRFRYAERGPGDGDRRY